MYQPAWLTQPWPTIATVALAIREGGAKPDCTSQDVLMAASARNVPVVNNRVPYGRLADLFFETRDMNR